MAPAPKTKRARNPPKAKGIKKPITKESHMKLLKKQVQQHNQRACIRVPKNASIKDLEDILSRRPVISKRPEKLTSANGRPGERLKMQGNQRSVPGAHARSTEHEESGRTNAKHHRKILIGIRSSRKESSQVGFQGWNGVDKRKPICPRAQTEEESLAFKA